MSTERDSRLGRLAGIFANLGIVVSLIYVGYEVRQNTQIARLQNHEASIRFLHDTNQPLLDEIDDVTDLMAKANLGLDSLSAKDLARYQALIADRLNLFEMSYYAFERGLMDEEIWSAWHAFMESYLDLNPSVVEAWSVARLQFGEGFRSVVDRLVDQR